MELDKEERMKELEERARKSVVCDFYDCCEYGRYNECYNHAHVMCLNYEVFFNKTRNIKKEE